MTATAPPSTASTTELLPPDRSVADPALEGVSNARTRVLAARRRLQR